VTGGGIVFVNPHAGADEDVEEIRSLFAGHDIEERDPGDLTDRVRDSLGRAPAFVGVAGGDGTIRSEGQPVVAWAVFVGNNRYGESLRELVGRDRLDAGVLDLRLAHADRRLSRLRIVAAVLFGRVPESPLVDRQELSSVELGFDRESVSVALDGECSR
jgi:diacylglycerol kinase family enzyme